MTLPDFGPPKIRPCDGCGKHVRFRHWRDRCPRCGAQICDEEVLAALGTAEDLVRRFHGDPPDPMTK